MVKTTTFYILHDSIYFSAFSIGSIYIDAEQIVGISNLDLILGLGLGIPLLLISATLVICGCCCHRFKCFKYVVLERKSFEKVTPPFRSCLSKMYNYSDDYRQSNRNLVDNSQAPSEFSSGKSAQTNKNSKTMNQRTIINKEYVSKNISSDGKGINSTKNTSQREDLKGLNNSNSSNDARSLDDTDHSSIKESKRKKKVNNLKEAELANNKSNEDTNQSRTNESNKNNTTTSYDLRELPLAYDFDQNQELTTTNVKHIRFLEETTQSHDTLDHSEQQIHVDDRPSSSNEKSSMVVNMTRTSLFSPPIEGLPTADVQYTYTTNPGSVLIHAYSVQENERPDSTSLC